MKWSALLFAVLACLAAGPLGAEDTPQALTVTGTVVSSDNDQLVLDTDSGRRTFSVDTKSTVPANLAVGSRVTIDYHDMGSGRLHLMKASLAPATSTGTTSTTTSTPPSRTGTTTGTAGTTGTMGTTGTTTDTTRTPIGDDVDTMAPIAGSSTIADRPTAGTDTLATADTTTGTTTTADPTAAGSTTRVARDLPATASPVPLVGLVGLLALAGGLAMRFVR